MPIPDYELASKFKGGRHELVTVASKRARELIKGARPLVKINSSDPLDIALAEIAAGKIKAQRVPSSTEAEEIKSEGNMQDLEGKEL